MSWDYKREETTFDLIPVGKHRIRIKSAEKTTSSKGNDMLALQFEVSGYKSILYHYIVNNEWANKNLTQFFDAFPGIKEGDMECSHWIGQVGACMVKHEEYNDQVSAKVKYFISASQQDDLPAWVGTDQVTFTEVSDDDLPF